MCIFQWKCPCRAKPELLLCKSNKAIANTCNLKYTVKTAQAIINCIYHVILSLSKISALACEQSMQVNVKNISPSKPPGTHFLFKQLMCTYLKQLVHCKPSAVMSTTGWLQYLHLFKFEDIIPE